VNCLVPDCKEEGRNKLGVRCRVWHDKHPTKKKTDALWSPDIDAYLCDTHANGGALITLLYEPTASAKIVIRAGTLHISTNRAFSITSKAS